MVFDDIESAAWLLMAIGDVPTSRAEIINICDGIMHAIPTDSEINRGAKWLTKNNLISKVKNGFQKTSVGNECCGKNKSSGYAGWKELVKILRTMA